MPVSYFKTSSPTSSSTARGRHDDIRSRRCLWCVAVFLIVTTSLIGCTSTTARDGTGFGAGAVDVPEPSEEVARAEREMHRRLNADRAEQGLPPLAWDDALADVGRAHSLDMIEGRFFEHTSPKTGTLEDRLDSIGYRFGTARENLAIGPNVQRAQDELLQSPDHYDNIMSTDVDRVGVGIVWGDHPEAGYVMHITQVFARALEPIDRSGVAAHVDEEIRARRADAGVPEVPRIPRLTEVARELAESGEKPSGTLIERTALALRDEDGVEIGGIGSAAISIFELDDFQVTSNMIGDDVVGVGIGTAETRDDRGRPTIRVVVLVAFER